MIKKETNESNTAEAQKALSAISQTMKEGNPRYLTYGLTEGDINSLYENACNSYFKKDYAEAINFFKQLATLNQLDPRGSMGMGLCFHQLGEYDIAAVWYLLSADIAPEGKTLFSAVDCFVALKNYPEAIKTLDRIISLSKEAPHGDDLKKEAEEAKKSLLQLV